MHNELDVVTMPRFLSWLMKGVGVRFDHSLDELCFLERCLAKGYGEAIEGRVHHLKSRVHGEQQQRLAFLEYQLVKSQDLCSALHVLQASYSETKEPMRGKMARRLAIHYEHDLKEFSLALDYARDTECEEGTQQHLKRLARLQRKLRLRR